MEPTPLRPCLLSVELAFDYHADQVIIDQLLGLSRGGHETGGSHLVDFPGDTLAVFMDHPHGGLGKNFSGGFGGRQVFGDVGRRFLISQRGQVEAHVHPLPDDGHCAR